MQEKRYLVVALVIISALIVSLFYANLVLGGDVTPSGKPQPEPMDVNVLNFPSEQNVKVTNFPTLAEPKVIVVVENYAFYSAGGVTYLATANVTGYRFVSIFVGYTNYDNDEDLLYQSSCSGIAAGMLNVVPMENNDGYYETGILGYEVGAPDLVFSVYSYYAGSTELTIVLYCYN